jgi:hypothetical protein
MTFYHAFIRTHHITSREKVALLKAAAKKHEVSALLRSGGVPGLMYVHGRSLDSVQCWVDVVHDLRYKDYQLVVPAGRVPEGCLGDAGDSTLGIVEEVEAVRDMAAVMERRGLLGWWKKAMGFERD